MFHHPGHSSNIRTHRREFSFASPALAACIATSPLLSCSAATTVGETRHKASLIFRRSSFAVFWRRSVADSGCRADDDFNSLLTAALATEVGRDGGLWLRVGSRIWIEVGYSPLLCIYLHAFEASKGWSSVAIHRETQRYFCNELGRMFVEVSGFWLQPEAGPIGVILSLI